MKKIGLLVYGRFPTEKAYGSHIIDIANGFIDNKNYVTVYYSKTNNDKTIEISPAQYYKNSRINYIEVKNFDFTKYRFYKILPSFIKKIIWNLGANLWSKNLNSYINMEDYLWSTNPNILLKQVSSKATLIYEKHGAGKYIQKYVINKLSKYKNVIFVGTSQTSFKELYKLSPEKTIYLTNGVSINDYKEESSRKKTNKLNIGYIGMLETYGKDKGVRKAFNELKKLSTDFDFKLTLIGGPSEKIDEIIEDFQDNETEFDHLYKIPKYEVPDYMKSLDIGIVPYPDDYHMSNYASPLKIFEYAASGAVVIASDIKSNLELKNSGLGIEYFKHDDYEDFKLKMKYLLENKKIREQLIENSKKNITNYSWEYRNKKLLDFCVRSSIG